jgi:hypothetical protein
VARVAIDVEKWAWWAFALTAVTGALMFITNASVYYHNIYFRLKMAMLVRGPQRRVLRADRAPIASA